ncbi:MAG: RHS repeat-associated core domain-containing protein [Bacteroidetes bacterium]|nr:MAG: RHS repeat-associated core domain-containing protein [Bacteroidota bacterium]
MIDKHIYQNDYYPFGMMMLGRSFSNEGYRFGFNGKENDGETQTQDYGFRIYNQRLGTFSSIDPLIKKFPFYSPYHYAGNNPVSAIDLDGLEDLWTSTIRYRDGSEMTFQIFSGDDNFENTRFQWAKEMGIDITQIPLSGSFTTYAEQTEIGVPLTNVQATFIPTVDIKPSKTFSDYAAQSGRYLDGLVPRGNAVDPYDGPLGLRKVGKDLSTTSTYVKGIGLAATLFAGPEIGIPIFEFGEIIDRGSTIANIASDVNEGKLEDAAIRLGADLVGAGAATGIGKINTLDESRKLGAKAGVDQSIKKITETAIGDKKND